MELPGASPLLGSDLGTGKLGLAVQRHRIREGMLPMSGKMSIRQTAPGSITLLCGQAHLGLNQIGFNSSGSGNDSKG